MYTNYMCLYAYLNFGDGVERLFYSGLKDNGYIHMVLDSSRKLSILPEFFSDSEMIAQEYRCHKDFCPNISDVNLFESPDPRSATLYSDFQVLFPLFVLVKPHEVHR